ncbi:MAG: 30S ribosomal protein S3 [Patescibacteria group bacterium]|nr:30S ribosomal protein S3 [Patescibacteria group bacterium]
MGRKVHPKIFRTGVIYSWSSKWFGSKQNMPELLRGDARIRSFLAKKLKEASVDRIEIERTPRAITVTVHSAKPGMIIGRGGAGVEGLKKELKKIIGKAGEKVNVNLNIIEVTKPSLSANIILQSMIADIERRIRTRRVQKLHLDRVQKAGAKGVKLQVKGRLNGAEIAREEKVSWGSIPLQNLRADVDYAQGFARTIYGTVGVKVWIYRGEVFGDEKVGTERTGLGEVVGSRGKPR